MSGWTELPCFTSYLPFCSSPGLPTRCAEAEVLNKVSSPPSFLQFCSSRFGLLSPARLHSGGSWVDWIWLVVLQDNNHRAALERTVAWATFTCRHFHTIDKSREGTKENRNNKEWNYDETSPVRSLFRIAVIVAIVWLPLLLSMMLFLLPCKIGDGPCSKSLFLGLSSIHHFVEEHCPACFLILQFISGESACLLHGVSGRHVLELDYRLPVKTR